MHRIQTHIMSVSVKDVIELKVVDFVSSYQIPRKLIPQLKWGKMCHKVNVALRDAL